MVRRHGRDISGLSLVAAGCFLGGVLYLGWQGGTLGSTLADLLLLACGRAAYMLPPIAFVLGILVIARSELAAPGPFRAGVALLIPTVLLAFGAGRFGLGGGIADPQDFAASAVVDQGGYLGAALYYASHGLVGDPGTTILTVLGIVLSVLFITGSSLQALVSWWGNHIGTAASAASTTSAAALQRVSTAAADSLTAAAGSLTAHRSGRDLPDVFGDVPAEYAVPGTGPDGGGLEPFGEDPVYDLEPVAQSSDAGQAAELLEPVGPEHAPGAQLSLPVDGGSVDDVDGPTPEAEPLLPPSWRGRPYRLPDPGILTVSETTDGSDPREVERIRTLLVETLGHFGIESRVVGVVPGPRVSRYELQLAPGTRMTKVENLRKDLAYALATTEIRILAPIPGKSAVGIEVENKRPVTVTLGDIHEPRPASASPLHVWLGKDISGQSIGADITKMPHLLVAGTTGAGKSGCMNAMLSSIVLGASPDEVRMVLIDPKKVELSSYEGIPHLLTPVVTNMKQAANALANIIDMMESRYSAMELAGARTLAEFNRVLADRGEDPVPYILVVIDELADLIMVSRSDVEDAVIRVAQKGRAAGFHMVLATQRPSVDVITGMIKSNIPSRIAFAVSSQTDSRVILDQNGAETLLGSGDMLLKPVWARSAQRVQGAWITEREVRTICDAARRQREPEYVDELLDERDADPVDGPPAEVDEDDRLAEAIRLAVEFQTCSASFFQRRMRVGYTRGARLVDMLERRGWVAEGEGPRARKVLVGQSELPGILAGLGAGPVADDEPGDG